MLDAWLNAKILIAEDHEMYRDGLKLLIQQTIDDPELFLAEDYPSTQRILHEQPDIDLLLLDIKLPGTQNLDGLKEIRSHYPTLTIIVISTLDFDLSIRNMIQLGANGFITKASHKSEMKQAIMDILAGNLVILSDNPAPPTLDLTQREMDTLQLISQGLSNKEIALQLHITPSTAKEYVSKIIKKLNAKNRTQAVLSAQKLGLLLDDFHH